MRLLSYINEIHKGYDEEFTDKLFLMDNYIKICLILIAYFAFVLKIGPKLMENRKAFILKEVLMVYNLLQVVASVYIFIMSYQSCRSGETLLNKDCKPTRDRTSLVNLYFLGYCYFLNKVSDLLDTVFFVLRKKSNQITFLHVYHHSSMALSTWAFSKYNPGEQLCIVIQLNSLVHVLMYTYYFVASLGPQYQKYVWWKIYMTKIQLIQFLLIIIYSIIIFMRGCKLSKLISSYLLFDTFLFLCLFYDFYRKTYKNSNRKSVNSN